MSQYDIKRRIELYLVEKLKIALPAEQILPYSGGSESSDVEEIEPPFTVVGITTASRSMATEGTWVCEGIVQVVTHHAETPINTHSKLARDVYEALSNIPSYGDAEFIFHGIDVGDMTMADDKESSAHADIISFAAGASG